jgi:site-specific recombinase XerC
VAILETRYACGLRMGQLYGVVVVELDPSERLASLHENGMNKIGVHNSKTALAAHPSLEPHKLRKIDATKLREAGAVLLDLQELLDQAHPVTPQGIGVCQDGSVDEGVKSYELVHLRA